jgi:hypothetical protein
MTQITRGELSHEHGYNLGSEDDEEIVLTPDGLKPTSTRLGRYFGGWRGWRGPLTVSGLALAVGIAGGVVHAKVFEGGDATAVAANKGVATAPSVPGATLPSANTAPTHSSGGFNNSGRLACTGMHVKLDPSSNYQQGLYDVTPEVSGGGNDADLYTVITNGATNQRYVGHGVGTVQFLIGNVVYWPETAIVDLAGTNVQERDLYQSDLGQIVPANHLAVCPDSGAIGS